MRGTSLLLLGVLIGACGPNVAEPRPLGVTLQSDRTVAAPGDSIQFEIRAQGEVLASIVVSWGDGQTSVISTMGAQTARSTQRHAFLETGVYNVTATVHDDGGGSRAASLSVRIQ